MNQFSILLSDNAIKHLSKVLQEGQSLHISLKVAGCNGFSYVFDVQQTDKANEIKVKGVSLVVKEEFREKLNFSTLDYKKEGLNSKLVLDNPQVKYQCGCGESISF